MIDVTDADFEAVVLEAERPVVVDFWAPWCRPCKVVERVLADLEEAHGDRVSFVRLDIDSSPSTPSHHGVLSIPTVLLFDGGEQRVEIVGARPRAHFEDKLAPWLRRS